MLPQKLLTQRILILGESIFEEGIAHLLKVGIDLQISCARYTNDLAFLSDIARNQPNAIVMNESATLNPPYILKLLFSIPLQAGLRVIIMRLSNNLIDVYAIPKEGIERRVYERRQFIVTKQAELVAVVRG